MAWDSQRQDNGARHTKALHFGAVSSGSGSDGLDSGCAWECRRLIDCSSRAEMILLGVLIQYFL